MKRAPVVLVALVAAVSAAGCSDPYSRASDRPSAGPASRAGAHDERMPPGSAPRAPIRPRPASTSYHAVWRFCRLWINWRPRTIIRQQRRLAALASGRLALQLEGEAALRTQEDAATRSRLAARGQVVAVEIVRSANPHRGVCLSRETLRSTRFSEQRYGVYVATLSRTAGGWAIARWEPQP